MRVSNVGLRKTPEMSKCLDDCAWKYCAMCLRQLVRALFEDGRSLPEHLATTFN
jgi:hypothetical protein